MAYGIINTASNTAKQLKELNRDYEGRRTWGSLYSTVDLQADRAVNRATIDYNKAVSDAYAAAYAQKTAISNSNLGSGFKAKGITDVNAALSQAYNTYKNNLNAEISAINEDVTKANNAITDSLMKEAQNYVDYEKSAYQYLQYLYDKAYDENEPDKNLSDMFENDLNWNKYIVTDGEGAEATKRLMTERELRERNYTMNEDGSYSINTSGTDFYHQMMDQLSQQGSPYGYYEWLSNTNPELYNWSTSANEYDYNEAGTKAGTYRKMLGLKSIPEQYTFLSNFGGITEKEVKDNVQSTVSDLLADIKDTGTRKDTKAAGKTYAKIYDHLTSYVNKLEISEEAKNDLLKQISDAKDYTAYSVKYDNLKNTSNSSAWNNSADVYRDWSYGKNALIRGTDGKWTVGGTVNNLIAGVMAGVNFAAEIIGTGLHGAVDFDATDRHNERIKQQNMADNREIMSDLEQRYLDVLTYITTYENYK